MIIESDFIEWIKEWENPESLNKQDLTEYEWNFLKSLQKKYNEFFYLKVCPSVDQHIQDENIGFYHNEQLCEFSAKQHLFINSINLTKLRDLDEWEIAYANRLDYTIIHVFLRGEEISYIACTF